MLPIKTLNIDKHISLRKIIPKDANEIFNTINKERDYLGVWLPFIAETQSINDSIDYINAIEKEVEESDISVFTIRQDQEFIGIVGFTKIDSSNRKTEIGYWLSKDYQGKGIMTRCVKEVCDYAFNVNKINRIQIKCSKANDRSKAIPKRLNFYFEGTERQGERLRNGEYADLEIYSKLKNEPW